MLISDLGHKAPIWRKIEKLTICAPPSGELILPADGLGSFDDNCVWVKGTHTLDRLSLLAENAAFALGLKVFDYVSFFTREKL